MCKCGGKCGGCKAAKRALAAHRARHCKPTHGVKREDGKFVVVANSGRMEGRYRSEKAAARRVRQVEYFKHAGG